MPATIQPEKVPFQEAINFFRGKLKISTEHWDSMLGDAHAKAFTVAGAMKADLLTELHQAVNDAITNGTTITEFRKQFDQAVQKHGWSYKGKRGWRTRVIYDTNMHAAHAAGRWSQFQRVKDRRPYLMYATAGDNRVRPQHRAWNKLVLHIDDPWWDTHYPPNGYGCRCGARSYSPRQLRKAKLTVTEQAPALNMTERVNTSSGEVYGKVPKGIDVGFDYNVGKAWLGPDIAFGEKIMAMPDVMRTPALKNASDLTPHLEKSFAPWANQLLTRKKPLGEIKTIGYLSPKVVDDLVTRGQAPTTAVITVTDKEVLHMIRDAKDGRHLPVDSIRALPAELSSAKAVLYDTDDPAILYVFDVPGDDRTGKVVLRLNYKTKARGEDGKRHSIQTNTIRTTGLVQKKNLLDKRYDVIDGEL